MIVVVIIIIIVIMIIIIISGTQVFIRSSLPVSRPVSHPPTGCEASYSTWLHPDIIIIIKINIITVFIIVPIIIIITTTTTTTTIIIIIIAGTRRHDRASPSSPSLFRHFLRHLLSSPPRKLAATLSAGYQGEGSRERSFFHRHRHCPDYRSCCR